MYVRHVGVSKYSSHVGVSDCVSACVEHVGIGDYISHVGVSDYVDILLYQLFRLLYTSLCI